MYTESEGSTLETFGAYRKGNNRAPDWLKAEMPGSRLILEPEGRQPGIMLTWEGNQPMQHPASEKFLMTDAAEPYYLEGPDGNDGASSLSRSIWGYGLLETSSGVFKREAGQPGEDLSKDQNHT
ncbi:hypothetical protein TWF506_001948 [Arthrobotrys conoides]|uniref:Uncharacterized protein n=1 Tax=Arthrobotrys conoides TaxID=74498 RepID=A0AAN8S5X4_9PEZI